MKKNNIRSKYVKDSLNEFSNLSETLKKNTTDAVRDLLDETVRNTYTELLSESEDDDNEEEYNVEEVEDTDSGTTSNEDGDTEDEVDTSTEDEDEGTDSEDSDDGSLEVEGDVSEDGEESSEGIDDDGDLTGETFNSGEDEDGGEWSEFEKYKVSDDEYDFSDAEDEEIVKVYKLLKNDDEVVVKKNDGKVNIKDNETGAEYIVELGDDDDVIEDNVLDDTEGDDFENEEENEFENMSESRIFEIALNEYDSNVGYTDNYQKKDVMTNPGMSEPGKNVNDWDAGVPHGTEKPWSGYPGKKNKADKPFNAGKGKTVEEEDNIEECGDNGTMEESVHTVTQNGPQRRSTTISQAPTTSRSKKVGRNLRTAEKPGQVDGHGTGAAAYQGVDESIRSKANQILKENRELKSALKQFKSVLQEAAVTNVNLGQIIKLITENSTSYDEKKEIIKRFGKEAKTVEASKNLYESISNELKKKNKMNINEEMSFTANSSHNINEAQIYQSKDLLDSLDLMHRLCK